MPCYLSGAERDVTFGQESFGTVGSEFHFFVCLGHFLENLTGAAGWFRGGARSGRRFIVWVHCVVM